MNADELGVKQANGADRAFISATAAEEAAVAGTTAISESSTSTEATRAGKASARENNTTIFLLIRRFLGARRPRRRRRAAALPPHGRAAASVHAMGLAQPLHRHEGQERRRLDEIPPEESSGLHQEPEEPLQAQALHPPGSPLDASAAEIERGTDAEQTDLQLTEVLRDPAVLLGSAQTDPENVGLHAVDIFDDRPVDLRRQLRAEGRIARPHDPEGRVVAHERCCHLSGTRSHQIESVSLGSGNTRKRAQQICARGPGPVSASPGAARPRAARRRGRRPAKRPGTPPAARDPCGRSSPCEPQRAPPGDGPRRCRPAPPSTAPRTGCRADERGSPGSPAAPRESSTFSLALQGVVVAVGELARIDAVEHASHHADAGVSEEAPGSSAGASGRAA